MILLFAVAYITRGAWCQWIVHKTTPPSCRATPLHLTTYVLFYLGQLSHFPSFFGAGVTNLNEPPLSFLLPPHRCRLGAGSIPLRAIVNKKQCETRGLFMSLVIHYSIGDVLDSQGVLYFCIYTATAAPHLPYKMANATTIEHHCHPHLFSFIYDTSIVWWRRCKTRRDILYFSQSQDICRIFIRLYACFAIRIMSDWLSSPGWSVILESPWLEL